MDSKPIEVQNQPLIGKILSFIISYVLYPAFVLFILGIIILALYDIVFSDEREGNHLLRRLTAASLPIIGLILIVSSGEQITLSFVPMNRWIQFSLAILLGAGLIEAGRYALAQDQEILTCFFIILLSSILVLIVLSLMSGVLRSLNGFLFWFIFSGGMDIVIMGAPKSINMSHGTLATTVREIERRVREKMSFRRI